MRDIKEFFTSPKDLRDKRMDEAKAEIEKFLYLDNLASPILGTGAFFLSSGYILNLAKLTATPHYYLKKTNTFCERYGINEKDFVRKTMDELELKYAEELEMFYNSLVGEEKSLLNDILKNRKRSNPRKSV